MKIFSLSSFDQFIIASKLPIYQSGIIRQLKNFGKKYEIINSPDQLSRIQKSYTSGVILFPHWSWKIPSEVLKKFVCIGFHPTDLPFGRGGSPFQNLIRKGISETVVTSFLICEQMDGGEILHQSPFKIPKTNIQFILETYATIIENQIRTLMENSVMPRKQIGEVIHFSRIKDNLLNFEKMELEQIFDEIRMVDGDGYKPARIEYMNHTLFFSDASFVNGSLTAKVIMVKKVINE